MVTRAALQQDCNKTATRLQQATCCTATRHCKTDVHACRVAFSWLWRRLALQHDTARHCNKTLWRRAALQQYTATQMHMRVFCVSSPWCDSSSHCNTLQRTATRCNTLQHIATHCNALQHTATHCTWIEPGMVTRATRAQRASAAVPVCVT